MGSQFLHSCKKRFGALSSLKNCGKLKFHLLRKKQSRKRILYKSEIVTPGEPWTELKVECGNSLIIDDEELLLGIEALAKQNAFLSLVYQHKEFFDHSVTVMVDSFILSMSYIYLERAAYMPSEYNSDRLFHALFLAIETEEEAPDARIEIIAYHVGVPLHKRDYNSAKVKTKLLYLSEASWKLALKQFYKGAYDMWRRLDYQTLVSREECMNVMQLLAPACEYFGRPRKACDVETLTL